MPDLATLKPVGGATGVQPDLSTLAPVAPTSVPAQQNTSGASFPAQANDSAIGGAAKLLGNIPSSALNFVKGAINMVNPFAIAKNIAAIPDEFSHLVQESGGVANAVGATAKQLLPSVYGALVPKAAQQVISGDFNGARQTLNNDPVGQILPFILVARGIAEKNGVGSQFDNAISTIAKPVTAPVEFIGSKIKSAVGTVAAETLGNTTGAGASSINEAFNHTQAFTDALRGKVNPDELVQTVQDAVSGIASNRRTQYLSDLAKVGAQKTSLDISPVFNTLDQQLKNFGVTEGKDGALNFSRSSIANNGTARADIQGVYDTLKDWGTQPGDRTAVGVDTLKKQLSDFYSPSGSARAFVQSVKGSVSDILQKQVPGYADMTKSYSEASSLLDDIKSATGIGSGPAKVDTVFTKLTSAMKGDKQLRLEVLNEIQAKGAQPDIMGKIAGMNMQTFFPKSLIGKGIDVGLLYHFFDPSFIPVFLSTSPRLMGEFVRALGLGADKTSAILNTLNNLRVPGVTAAQNNAQDKQPPSSQ